jgi:hypothetical protein
VPYPHQLAEHEGIPIREPDASAALISSDAVRIVRAVDSDAGAIDAIQTMPTGLFGPGGSMKAFSLRTPD